MRWGEGYSDQCAAVQYSSVGYQPGGAMLTPTTSAAITSDKESSVPHTPPPGGILNGLILILISTEDRNGLTTKMKEGERR